MKATGERWERRRWREERPERVAAVSEGRRGFSTEDIRWAPQQEKALVRWKEGAFGAEEKRGWQKRSF